MSEQNLIAGPARAAYKITIWCESDRPEYDLAMALEQGELWDAATNVQYQIVQVTESVGR